MALKLDVLLNLDNLSKSLGDIGNFAKSAERSLSGIESAFKFVGVAAAAIGVGFSIKEIVGKAEEGAQAILQLNTALKLSGDFTEETSKSYQALASSIEKTANISDETILSLVAQAKAIGLTNDETTKITKASVDLAAVLGTDVNSAFNDLQRTLGGDVPRSIAKLFPEIKTLSAEQLANGEAVTLLASRYNGAAAELNANFGGALKGVALQFGNVLENLGKVIIENPIIVSALNTVKDALIGIAKVIDTNVGPAIEFINKSIATVSSFFIDGVSANINYVATLVEIAKTIGTLLGPVINDLILPILSDFINGSRQIASVLDTILQPALEFVSKGFQFLGVGVLGVVRAYQEFRGNTEAVARLDKSIDGLVESSLKNNSVSKESVNLVNTQISSAKQYIDVLGKTAEAQKSLTNATVKASDQRKKAISEEQNLRELQRRQQQRQLVSGAAQNPFQAIQNLPLQLAELKQKGATETQLKETEKNTKTGAAIGALADVLKGPQGAVSLLSQTAGFIGDTILPGIGGVVGQVFSVLAQGPEAARGFVTGFINAIPQIVENIILAIPAVIEALTNGLIDLPAKLADSLVQSLPTVIGQLAAQAPAIAVRFSIALSAQAPFIAVQFAISFVRDGVPAIVKGFIDEIKKQAGSLGGLFGGGGGGGVLDSIGSVFGFAGGGAPVFSGGDNILAGFNAKELVIDKSDTQRLSAFLDQQERRATQNQNNQNLAAGKPQSVMVTHQTVLDRKVLAESIFSLDLDGFRVRAT